MSTDKDKRIQILQQASLDKQAQTMERTLQALQRMQEQCLPINFQSVAKYAKVSKVWLYSVPDIREQINTLRDQSGSTKKMGDVHDLLAKKETQITDLTQKPEKSADMIKQLRTQLEVAYGELYKRRGKE